MNQTGHGSVAVWVLVFAELTEFAFFFIVFLVVRYFFPDDFAAGPERLNTQLGFANSVILISSSFSIAMAQRALRRHDVGYSKVWLFVTIGCGLAYCLNKYMEYNWNELHGIQLQVNYFFTLYYYLTFNHLLHVLFGITALSICLLALCIGWVTPSNSESFEGSIVYWHMVDLAWIILFPLLYLLH